MDTTVFETGSTFDAINRFMQITLPENVNSERKQIVPAYNRAGALEKVSYDGTEYVENIAYNAKGQRLLITFGNAIMTRYTYDNFTFRLLRQRSEKYLKAQAGNVITYTPQSGTGKQDDGFNFDLVGNILKILNRVNDCGIAGSMLGSNALDRNFEYDPLYRVISADGRESNTQNQNDYLYNDAPAPGTPNASNVRAYTRKYAFDRIGNIQQVKQLGANGFTRNFTYNAGYNTLQKVETPTPSLIEDFTYDACGNQITAGTTRNYVWNAGNQLITYYNQAGSADPTIFAQYDYSGMNRVSKFVRTGTSASPIYERTVYIDGIFEYHILENGTTFEKNYVHVMDDQSRIAMVRIGDVFPDDIVDAVTYNLEDQIGSSVARLDVNGTIIDREEYYPFGDSSLRTFTKKRYRYVGKEKDLESGLYYYGARYYVPWTCRFISIDPLAADYMHLTPYNYAGNKPITHYDIDGMQSNGEQQSAPGSVDKPQPAASTYVDKSQYIKVNNVENKYQFDPQFLGIKVSLFDKTKEFHEWNSQVKSFVKEATNNLDDIQSINSIKIVHIKPVLEDSYKQRDVYMLNKLSINYTDTTNNQKTYEINFKVYANSISFSGSSPIDYVLIGASAKIFLKNSPTIIKGLNNTVKGGLTNSEVRIWYNNQLKSLNTSVPFTKENAMALHTQRNTLKIQAREMMADREAAALLNKTDPIRTFQYYVKKYSAQGYSGETLWKKIIQGSRTPNAGVNSKFGIK